MRRVFPMAFGGAGLAALASALPRMDILLSLMPSPDVGFSGGATKPSGGKHKARRHGAKLKPNRVRLSRRVRRKHRRAKR